MTDHRSDTLLTAAIENGTDWGNLDIALRHLRYLLAHICDIADITLFSYPETRITASQQQRFLAAVAELAEGKPLSRVIGRRDFWTLSFSLNTATLDPRPDSELLIEAALDHPPPKNHQPVILDIGTGSGCLVLALLSEWPNTLGVGIDIQLEAIAQAQENAKQCRIFDRSCFFQADFSKREDFLCRLAQYSLVKPGQFEYIVCNPPYIKTHDIAHLQKQVRDYDPIIALDGGDSGYDAYHHLADFIPPLLAEGGWCFLEVGMGQAQHVAEIFREKGLEHFQIRSDLSGIARLVMMKKSSS